MKVFYMPQMIASVQSYSPSASKPKLVVEDWMRHPSLADHRPVIKNFSPVGIGDLSMVHDLAFVEAVMSGSVANGFGNTDPAVARACLYTCGSMLAATAEAIATKEIVCSPTSGFHHAGFDYCGGFCTFNGLALAAFWARRLNNRVTILDLDRHGGDGTADIMRTLPKAFDGVRHFSFGLHLRRGESVFDFIERALSEPADIVLYQAGADMHVNDTLGGAAGMDDEAMYERDELVFRLATEMNAGVAWNLAGGYRWDKKGTINPVLKTHRNTYIAAVRCSQKEVA